jgi:hypothetical protein
MTRVTAVLAVVLLPLVWPVGVVLLWMSRVWTTGAKLAGTFLLPGGLASRRYWTSATARAALSTARQAAS